MADSIQILERVHSFYSDSFSQLMLWTMALLAFAGILMPLLNQYMQSRASRLEKESLENLMKTKAQEMRSELTSLLSTRFAGEEKRVVDLLDAKVDEAITSVQREVSGAKAGVFHLQAIQNVRSSFYALAVRDCASAVSLYLDANDERNLQAILSTLADTCLPRVKKVQMANEPDIESSVKSVVDLLTSHNENGRYSIAIDDLQTKLKAAKQRVN